MNKKTSRTAAGETVTSQSRDVLKNTLLIDAMSAQRNKDALKEALFGALAPKLQQLNAKDIVQLIKDIDGPESLNIYQEIFKMIEDQ